MGIGQWRCACVILAVVIIASVCGLGRAAMVGGRFGARHTIAGAQNDLQLQNLAKFAVDEHDAKQNASLVFVRLVSVEQQVVAGTMYYLVLEAAGERGGGVRKIYEAQVWVKPWENFKSLQGFKEEPASGTQPHTTIANNAGVSCDDATVKDAAAQVMLTLWQRSNSLAPYELKEIVSVHAQVRTEGTLYELILITQRGSKEEKFDAKVVRAPIGTWMVDDVQLLH